MVDQGSNYVPEAVVEAEAEAAENTLLTTAAAFDMALATDWSLWSASERTATAAGRVEAVKGALGCGALAQYGRTTVVIYPCIVIGMVSPF